MLCQWSPRSLCASHTMQLKSAGIGCAVANRGIFKEARCQRRFSHMDDLSDGYMTATMMTWMNCFTEKQGLQNRAKVRNMAGNAQVVWWSHNGMSLKLALPFSLLSYTQRGFCKCHSIFWKFKSKSVLISLPRWNYVYFHLKFLPYSCLIPHFIERAKLSFLKVNV